MRAERLALQASPRGPCAFRQVLCLESLGPAPLAAGWATTPGLWPVLPEHQKPFSWTHAATPQRVTGDGYAAGGWEPATLLRWSRKVGMWPRVWRLRLHLKLQEEHVLEIQDGTYKPAFSPDL